MDLLFRAKYSTASVCIRDSLTEQVRYSLASYPDFLDGSENSNLFREDNLLLGLGGRGGSAVLVLVLLRR